MEVWTYIMNHSYWFLVIPALLISLFAQLNVTSTFRKYNSVRSRYGVTADAVARQILDANGLYQVEIQRVAGNLSDHYDPRANVIRLSDSTYGNASVGAIGVAAHEVGHAIQYATGYSPIRLRQAVIPVSRIGSIAAVPLALLGIIFSLDFLITAGIVLFSTVVLFQLVTLPVEFNASGRALRTLETQNLLEGDELKGARKVLRAAALTYVAALLVSLANLLRLIALANRRR